MKILKLIGEIILSMFNPTSSRQINTVCEVTKTGKHIMESAHPVFGGTFKCKCCNKWYNC
jgi:hypothetical protein